ncbi:hypothetical protein GUITHDRAFT_118058 [Guillardia theta CCMP2712]|uniref:Uncharacterized protein n=1 Tax=Guillardia theta (strain CCMP2712) TaxID=905079 RepID=L1IJ05_GUITC|nr:hypothetical protein GUITHDRAFT_118058 [Guillardia theta CCMP2712]EKX35780.1 hypothetical protein GUITHDRAFT_118058 [Guillardia theta CCMP2712]|eukprot:XP_005822760.1 hypothetical protein GUITHDRAFT_118058 [Guillardia theta CCMP2712]
MQEQQQVIRQLESRLSENEQRVNEAESLRTRLSQADAAILERDKIIARMRSAASVVDKGITEMQLRYDEILARMADEITELQRIQQKHGYRSDSLATSRTRSNIERGDHDDESSSTADEYSESESLSSTSSMEGAGSLLDGLNDSSEKMARRGRRVLRARSCILTSNAVHLLRLSVVQGSWFEEPAPLRNMLLRLGFNQLKKRLHRNLDEGESSEGSSQLGGDE